MLRGDERGQEMLICEGWALLGLRPLYLCHPDSSGVQASVSLSIYSPSLPLTLGPRSHGPGTATATGRPFPSGHRAKASREDRFGSTSTASLAYKMQTAANYIQRNEWPN